MAYRCCLGCSTVWLVKVQVIGMEPGSAVMVVRYRLSFVHDVTPSKGLAAWRGECGPFCNDNCQAANDLIEFEYVSDT